MQRSVSFYQLRFKKREKGLELGSGQRETSASSEKLSKKYRVTWSGHIPLVQQSHEQWSSVLLGVKDSTYIKQTTNYCYKSAKQLRSLHAMHLLQCIYILDTLCNFIWSLLSFRDQQNVRMSLRRDLHGARSGKSARLNVTVLLVVWEGRQSDQRPPFLCLRLSFRLTLYI